MRVLYRHFLFRVVDLELIAPQGDMSRLLGQFAAFLIFWSILLSARALGLDATRMPRPELLRAAWPFEHSLLSATMLVVGLFAVLSWDSLFPDRRDAMVLGPLPLPARSVFLAKMAAVGTALGVTVAALNVIPSLALTMALAEARTFAAYWFTVAAAGVFVFGLVLTFEGLGAALLPHRLFVRVSAAMQIAAFCAFVTTYFVSLREYDPALWFLALLQQVNGTADPRFDGLAWRAWAGLGMVAAGIVLAYGLSYFRVMRKVVEQPDIEPARGFAWGRRIGAWMPPLAAFTVRTLLRSRQHRVLFAFYLGLGFAIVIVMLKGRVGGDFHLETPDGRVRLMFSSLIAATVWILGTRVVYALPVAARANWIFRLSEVRPVGAYIAQIRRAVLAVSAAPVWLASAVFFFAVWDPLRAAAHLAVLGCWSLILTFVSLRGFRKIPFTCSYLPGKMSIHMRVLGAIGGLVVIAKGVDLEVRLIQDCGTPMLQMIGALGGAALAAYVWMRLGDGGEAEAIVQYEEEVDPAVMGLGLAPGGRG